MFGPCLVFCRVYTPDHSYVTIRSRLSCRVGEILALVKEKLQYSEDQPTQPANLILVAVTSSGGKSIKDCSLQTKGQFKPDIKMHFCWSDHKWTVFNSNPKNENSENIFICGPLCGPLLSTFKAKYFFRFYF